MHQVMEILESMENMNPHMKCEILVEITLIAQNNPEEEEPHVIMDKAIKSILSQHDN
jgi:wyosine [tRNA(Phe)-imidazoG37] synthetase (radical SAM superfamily)